MSHDFLGISLKVCRDNWSNLKNSTVKLRVLNKAQYEPFLEENERRVYDIIQVYPKDFIFNPAAEITLRLPSCVSPECSGQLVCLYSSNFWVRNGVRHLKWRPVDSECFEVNSVRTEAKLVCKKTGVYTIKLTPHPELTKELNASTTCEVKLSTQPKLQVKFPAGCVTKHTNVTLKVVRIEDLYNSPAAIPVSPTTRSRLPSDWLDRTNERMIDITSSPVALVRPTRSRFTKPVHLTLPLLGDDFEDFFVREDSRLVVLKSRVLNEEEIEWKHHYSTPEVQCGSILGCLACCCLCDCGSILGCLACCCLCYCSSCSTFYSLLFVFICLLMPGVYSQCTNNSHNRLYILVLLVA